MAEEFTEAALGKPIRDLGLTIAGTPLESIVETLMQEVVAAGIRRLRPRFYLSTEWGVPQDTIAVAMPFYLAHPELTELHGRRAGHVEGLDAADILRYLRHEMGHAVSYAYELHSDERWTELFGRFDKRYREEYRPKPFSRKFVRHLPGWYAQKHPQEDWAETFAVWLTPGSEWRREYADWPTALAKLTYCDEVMRRVGDREPLVTDEELDEDVGDIAYTLGEFYGDQEDDDEEEELPRGIDGALRDAFAGLAPRPGEGQALAAALLRRLERELTAQVYRWTGHFPERTRALVRRLAGRAEALALSYGQEHETAAVVAVTALVAALATTHVTRGRYDP
jgi:hypothetical protein